MQMLAHHVWWGGGPVTDDGIFAYFICKNNESQTLSVQRCIHASPQKQAR